MRKMAYVAAALLAVFAFVLTACPEPEEPKPSVTSVTVTGATEIKQGASATFTAVVKVKNKAKETVTWSLVSGDTGDTALANTVATVNSSGAVTVSDTAAAETKFRVKATSTVSKKVSGYATVTVKAKDSVTPPDPDEKCECSKKGAHAGDCDPKCAEKGKAGYCTCTEPVDNTPKVTSVTVKAAGDATTLITGQTLQFTADVVVTNNAAKTVKWTVTTDPAAATGVTISDAGLLNIQLASDATKVTVKATSTVDDTKSDAKEITVTKSAATVDSVTVKAAGDATSVVKGKTLQLTADVATTGTPEPPKTVTWSVTVEPETAKDDVKIDDKGVLSVASISSAATKVTVKATSTADETKSGTKEITVADPVCECEDCDLKGKSIATAAAETCSCEPTETLFGCDDGCVVCIIVGGFDLTGAEAGLKGTRVDISTTGKTVLFDMEEDDLIGDGFIAAGRPESGEILAKFGVSAAGIVYITGTAGNGLNYLQILPPETVELENATSTYRLNFAGRYSEGKGVTGGRMEVFVIGGDSALADCTTSNSTGISISQWGNGVTINNTTGIFNADITLTEDFVKNGIKVFINQWEGDNPADKTFSIDDLIVYEVPATPIDNFAITLTAPVANATPQETIDSTQFTGEVTWSPEPVDGKFALNGEYTATIVIKAKAGFHAESLDNDAAFTINGALRASYNAVTKTVVSAKFPAAVQPPPLVTFDFTVSVPVAAGGGAEVKANDATSYTARYNYTTGTIGIPLTIEAGFNLGQYTSVTFTITGTTITDEGGSDNANYKQMSLLAAVSLGGYAAADVVSKANVQYSQGEQKLTLLIDSAKTSSLTGAIQLAIHIAAPSNGAEYVVKDVKLNP